MIDQNITSRTVELVWNERKGTFNPNKCMKKTARGIELVFSTISVVLQPDVRTEIAHWLHKFKPKGYSVAFIGGHICGSEISAVLSISIPTEKERTDCLPFKVTVEFCYKSGCHDEIFSGLAFNPEKRALEKLDLSGPVCIPEFSKAETDIYRMSFLGLGIKEAAEAGGYTRAMVKKYRDRILSKLGVKNFATAIKLNYIFRFV